ncbi:hypothetical protein STEG23_012387 [Scotinomys teguina]
MAPVMLPLVLLLLAGDVAVSSDSFDSSNSHIVQPSELRTSNVVLDEDTVDTKQLDRLGNCLPGMSKGSPAGSGRDIAVFVNSGVR